jgi:pimeloyl-ACP methyl ester carboxylesterase
MQINDLDISFNDSGEGLPIVLLHGLALDKSIWSQMVVAYSTQERFITPDLRGHAKQPLVRPRAPSPRWQTTCLPYWMP